MRQVRDHCPVPARTGGTALAGGRYTRLFPELPALAIEPEADCARYDRLRHPLPAEEAYRGAA